MVALNHMTVDDAVIRSKGTRPELSGEMHMRTHFQCLMAIVLAGSVAQAATPRFECRVTGKSIVLLQAGQRILQYNTAVVEPPEGAPAVYRRSGHIHPVWTPSGKIVTSEFPADHLHQHGIFRAWVRTTFDGRKIDFWNQKAETGKGRARWDL